MPIENLIKKENRVKYWKTFFLLCGLFLPATYVYLFFANQRTYYFPLMMQSIQDLPARYYIDMGIELLFFTVKYFILIAPSLMILAIIIIEGHDLLIKREM